MSFRKVLVFCLSNFSRSLKKLSINSEHIFLARRLFSTQKVLRFQHRQNISKHRIWLAGLLTWIGKKTIDDSGKDNRTSNSAELELLQKADDLFENGYYSECYELLKSKENPDVEIKWRICRALYNMSKEPTCKKSIKRELILEAYQIVSLLLNEHYENFAVQKWYALLLDAKSTHDGIKARITQLESVKKHMDLAVTLNPSDATTLYMLGEWCYQVADMPWHQRKIAETLFASPPYSTYEDALQYYLKAEAVQPRFYSLNLLRLGHCYLKLNKEDQAKYYLQLAAGYPAKSNDDHQANREATELLKRLK